MKPALLVALLLSATPVSAQVRVYMKPPADQGFVDATSKGQRDTFNDLKEQLAKKALLELVEAPEQADVTISILDRDFARETGKTSTSTTRGIIGLNSTTEKDTTLAVTILLSAGEYKRELSASDKRLIGPWKAIAGKLANQVEKWAKENAQTIAARR